MKPIASALALGVSDVERSKAFYADGLGWPMDQEAPGWIRFVVNDGAFAIGMKSTEALARDAGVPADRSGFAGVSFSYHCGSEERVDEVIDEAEKAGGTVVKPADKAKWGGYNGYFADPDGYLWQVVHAAEADSLAAD